MTEAPQHILAAILKHFNGNGLTVATAESCTGGILASWLTELPGSSAVFLGGVSVYSYKAKTLLLGVSEDLILSRGAVSAEVAAAMATGAKAKLSSDFALSLTGIAGPDGGTPAKPVGTVWCGLAHPKGVETRLFKLKGTRSAIREASALKALEWLLQTVQDKETNKGMNS